MSKNIIITGASRGIGRELAKKHLQNGHSVIGISRNRDRLRALKQFENGGTFTDLSIDLCDYESIDRVLESIREWNRVDVLYNNAGYLVYKAFSELTGDDLERSISVNYKAPFRLIQLVLPKMNASSHIVNITTMGAVQGSVKFPGLAAYSSSKSGIVTLTELLAEELKEGPGINCVALGSVQTEMFEEAFPGAKAAASAEEIAGYLYRFGMEGHRYQNGKLVQLSTSTP